MLHNYFVYSRPCSPRNAKVTLSTSTVSGYVSIISSSTWYIFAQTRRFVSGWTTLSVGSTARLERNDFEKNILETMGRIHVTVVVSLICVSILTPRRLRLSLPARSVSVPRGRSVTSVLCGFDRNSERKFHPHLNSINKRVNFVRATTVDSETREIRRAHSLLRVYEVTRDCRQFAIGITLRGRST